MELHYEPLNEQIWEDAIEKFKVLVANFFESNDYSKGSVGIFETSVFQIITKVDQRKQYFAYFHDLDISDFKELALYCFWILKIKPLYCAKENVSEEEKIAFESLNEKFALFYIIKKFRALAGEDDKIQNSINKIFSPEYMYELIYSFTYRDISKESLILLVETMAIALGFQPYNRDA